MKQACEMAYKSNLPYEVFLAYIQFILYDNYIQFICFSLSISERFFHLTITFSAPHVYFRA